MVEIVLLIIAVVLAVNLVARLLTANLLWRSRPRAFFAEAIHQFLIHKGDGGSLVVRQRGGPVQLRVRRVAGEADSSPLAVVEVPRAPWSRVAAERLERALESLPAGIDGAVVPAAAPGDEAAPAAMLARVRVSVADIWDPHSAAPVAQALCDVLDALEVPRKARFRLEMEGPESLRALARARRPRG